MINYAFKAKLNPDGSRYIDPVTNDFVNELVGQYDDGIVEQIKPNWRGLTDDLFNSNLFSKAITLANPNVYATFTKVLTDGEHSGTKEDVLKSVLQMFTFFTADDIIQINSILSNNNFTIRL